MTIVDMMLDAKQFINKGLFSADQVEKVLNAYNDKKSITTNFVVKDNADIYAYLYKMVKMNNGFLINISSSDVSKNYNIE